MARDANENIIVIIDSSELKLQNKDQITTNLLFVNILAISNQSLHRTMLGKDRLVVLIKAML